MRREYNIRSLLPDGCELLQYIKGTGTQYIDTGLSMPNGFIVKCKAQYQSLAQSGSYIVGCHKSTSPYGRNGLCFYRESSRYGFQLATGNVYPNTFSTFPTQANTWYDIEASTLKTGKYLIVNGITLISEQTHNQYLYEGNILIFSNQYRAPATQALPGKIAYLQLYNENGVLVRDYVPALRLQDNKPGFYDLCGSVCSLTGTPFYINAGTGDFLDL